MFDCFVALALMTTFVSLGLHVPPAVGSVAGCIQPVPIHFPAYSGKSVIKKVRRLLDERPNGCFRVCTLTGF